MAEVNDFTSKNTSYDLAFKAFKKVTDDDKTAIASIRQNLPTSLKNSHLSKDKPTFNILSIGAGDGFMDQEILKIVQEGYLNTDKQLQEVRILNTAVEPNTEFLGQYKESIERRLKEDESVEFDLKPMSFEQYTESKHDQNQYDMIHAIHSLYYVDSIESTLKHCYYHELGGKGLLVCLLIRDFDPYTAISTVMEKFRSDFQKKRFIGRSTVDIIRVAEKNSMKYEKVVVPFSVDVTSVFDESSEEGRHLLDFFTHEDNYRKTADQNEVKEVLKKMKDLSTEDDCGRLNLTGINELVLIYKTS